MIIAVKHSFREELRLEKVEQGYLLQVIRIYPDGSERPRRGFKLTPSEAARLRDALSE